LSLFVDLGNQSRKASYCEFSMEVPRSGHHEAQDYFLEAESKDFRDKIDYGRVVFKTKHVYTGNLVDWYFQGPGRYVWVDGTVYQVIIISVEQIFRRVLKCSITNYFDREISGKVLCTAKEPFTGPTAVSMRASLQMELEPVGVSTPHLKVLPTLEIGSMDCLMGMEKCGTIPTLTMEITTTVTGQKDFKAVMEYDSTAMGTGILGTGSRVDGMEMVR